ncbi:hypothetical protein JCM17823_05850 [Halorubrum gandharaense]
MPSDHTDETSSTSEGPRLLEERSIGGILVHFLAIPTGVIGAGLVYLVSSNEFTKRNARNALDWHLTVLTYVVVTFGLLFIYAELTGQGTTDAVILPSPIASGGFLVISALLTLSTGVVLWTIVVAFIAIGKATFGTAWRYPLSPALVDRYGSRISLPGGWPLVILAYVLLVPVVFGAVFSGPRDGTGFLLTWLGLFGLILFLAPVTTVAMYLHGERDRPPNADWQPHVIAYLGIPVAVAVVGYALSSSVTDSINPGGDAVYVFLAAFWVSSIVYAVRWWTTTAKSDFR